MPRKRQKNRKTRSRKTRSAPATPLSIEQREAAAVALLREENYREAINAFKALLSQEQRESWKTALAEAYAGRSRSLEAKGMLKEAIVIWRNRAENCAVSLADPEYINLLWQSGQFDTASELIREHFSTFEEAGHLPRLREQCAVQSLAGRTELLSLFPDDDPLRRDHPSAQSALEAYCTGQDGQLAQLLKAIPFRSPFRDLRQLLRALSLLPDDEPAARALLTRVDEHSAFWPLARAIETALAPGAQFLDHYSQLQKSERHFAATLRGIPDQALKLLHELQQLGAQPADDKLLRFLLRHKAQLGETYVREMAQRIMVRYPRGKSLVTRSLGQLSAFEQKCIEALREERNREEPQVIISAWYGAARTLDEVARQPGSDAALRQALVVRRLADLMLRHEPGHPGALEQLELALQCDPDDIPRHLQLIRSYRESDSMKDARRALDAALARYPDNTGVLTEAVETAITSKAYKKAARFARQVLALDPINQRVRDILVQAHLAHARKLIHQRKAAPALNELCEAQNWARSEAARGDIDLVEALIKLDQNDKLEARRLLQSGYQRHGEGLCGRLQLLAEASRQRRSPSSILKLAKLPPLPKPVAKTQVLALLEVLGKVDSQDPVPVQDALQVLGPALKPAAGLAFSETEMRRLCETWSRLERPELTTRYARAALKHWPGRPLFVFHEVESRADQHGLLNYKDTRKLREALALAREEGDTRTAHRIDDYLYAKGAMDFLDNPFGGPFGNPFGGAFEDDFEDEDEDDASPLSPMGQDLEAMLEILMNTEGPAEFELIKQLLGPEKARAVLQRMIEGDIDPSLLGELLPDEGEPPKRKRRRRNRPDDTPEQQDLF